MKRFLVAATLAAAFWGFKRWLDHRHLQLAHSTPPPTEPWENEGGALARDPATIETSHVPR